MAKTEPISALFELIINYLKKITKLVAKMGITPNTMEMLAFAKQSGTDYSSTATLGRQQYYHCTPESWKSIVERYNLKNNIDPDNNYNFLKNGKYTEFLFEILGARNITAFDADTYQKANHVHDFNKPISNKFHNKYSCFFDGGSLEHIFNTPVAIANCMNLVALNGHYLAALPCNNWGGHGFYQFNPELFYRVLCEENGFSETKVFAYNEVGSHKISLFPDPKVIKYRIEFRALVTD